MTAKSVSFFPGQGWLIGVAVAGFIVIAIAQAPASLMAPALNANARAIQYSEVKGTIWRGEIRGLSSGEVYLGDVTYRFRPLPLLTGNIAVDVSAVGGAGVGRGRISANFIAQSVTAENVRLRFDLSSVKQYTLFGITYQGRIEAHDLSLSWGRNGCGRATGEIWTDVLDASSKRFVGESLLLAGPVSCEDGRIGLTLAGGNRQGEARIGVSVDASMTYHVVANVSLDREDLEAVLREFGFEKDDDALVYDVVGALKGTGI